MTAHATAAALLDPATGTACVVTDMVVEADVLALDATIRVTQRFRNPLEATIEAVYVFPLPPLAAVSAMRATLGGRTVVARLKERGEARRDYAEAVAAGRRAALAEEERPSTFTMTVGNLAGGEEAEVVLELVGPVEVTARLDAAGVVAAWEAVLRLPTVVAPRYTEGLPLGGADVGSGTAADTDRVPDASRVTPPVGEGVGPSLTWRVGLDAAGLPLGAIDAPPGADRTPAPGGGVVLAGRGVGDADVTVRWELAPTSLAVSAAFHLDREPVAGREGLATVSVTIVPPVGTRPRPPADVVIALDRSGSMQGWKMRTAIRAARRLLDTLVASDRVGLVAFDTVVEGPELGLLPLTGPNRERLHERLEGVDARGGTELTAAITAAAQLLGRTEPGRERLVLLVTDAQVSGEAQAVAAASASGARFVVVGVDTAVNHGLLERLGSATGGSSTAVTAAGELDRAVETARHRLGAPTLDHLDVQVDGAVAGSLAGDHRDVVWPDAVARLGLRVAGGDASGLTVRLDADGPSGRWSHRLPAAPTASEAGRLTWARARLRALEDDYDGGGTTEPSDLVSLSLAHGVLCRFTAFVAVDDRGEPVGDGTPPPTLVQPSELPAGWAAAAMMPPPAPMMASRPRGGGPTRATTADAASHEPGWSRRSAAPITRAFSTGPGGVGDAAPGEDFWTTRPTGTDGHLQRLVRALHESIIRYGADHRRARAALADLLAELGRRGIGPEVQALLGDLVAGGADLAITGTELVVHPVGDPTEVCRVELRSGRVTVGGQPSADPAEALRRLDDLTRAT